ncbi:SfnB family sulfur acquisition oxidoreductase [Granulibacter bethesdensis]|uniref:SfnB family sulfur acquisition oxidoreductase n=1 Tax=Granulibacter bethesdensis TaxID=364410 RepID=UPI00090B9498|nr:SfnB family sulfur acquisition oxidoreductase [Granulibacter bethesdensis]APH58962.1 Dibenzothiophene monooxygenase dszC [Granulibacter bethesdensis]
MSVTELDPASLRTESIPETTSTPHRVGSGERGVPGVPRPAQPAYVITSDAEAIEVAHRLAARFAEGASERDRHSAIPRDELDEYSQSGLWAINVPRAFGGADVSYATVAEVIRIISAADPSIGQITQNHLGIVFSIRANGTPEQQSILFGEILRGTRLGNAFSERGTKNVAEFVTRFTDDGDHVIVTGRKYYSSGALLAHLVPIVALDDQNRAWYAIADRNAPGLTVINDWSAFGQRGTASGTVLIDHVRVPKTHLIAGFKAYDPATVQAESAIFQIIQAAVDAGIAEAAIKDTIRFVREKARPWIDAGQDNAWEDPYTIQTIASLQIRLNAALAILEKAGHAIDEAVANPTTDTVARAQIITAESKVLTTEVAIEATNKLFELGGTSSTDGKYNFDRHWRNARTHTLHDPVRWKYAAIGNYYLNGINPPLHAWS